MHHNSCNMMADVGMQTMDMKINMVSDRKPRNYVVPSLSFIFVALENNGIYRTLEHNMVTAIAKHAPQTFQRPKK